MSAKIITQTQTCSEFYDFCTQPPKSSQRASRSQDSQHGESWSGTASYQDAQQLARVGWPEGTTRARKLAQDLSAELVTAVKRPEIVFDVTGESFDMGRVMDGTPESWMTWTEGQEEGGQPVHIVLNSSVSWTIDKKMIELRGSSICALVIILEAAGRPCKVEVASGIEQYSGPFLEPRVIVKDFFDPIQIDAVAYALMHTSFFRRHIFSAVEVMGVTDGRYGVPADLRGTQGDIYLGRALGGDKQWTNEQSAKQWIRTQLDVQGVTFSK